MGYLFLSLSLLSSLTIAVILKVLELKNYDRIVVIASNYIIATALGFALSRPSDMGTGVIPFAVIAGLLFFSTFVVYSFVIKKDGIAPAVTFGRISMAIPVIVSIIFWGERPEILNWLGLGAVFWVILTWEGKINRLSSSLLALFLLSGSISTSMKFFKVKFPMVDEGKFLVFLFASALVWSWVYIFITERKVKLPFLLGGLFIGIPNFFSSYFLLKALTEVPAYISFPFISVNLIVLSSLAGYLIFSEKLTRRKLLLIVLAAAGVGLLSV